MRIAALVGALSMWSSVAFADAREQLVASGEQLAREGRYAEAVGTFKEADRIATRAKHACLIALAYMRQQQWAQADLFLARCHQRSGAADPLPSWVPGADRELAKLMDTANVAPIEIRVAPASADARVTLDDLPDDEQFPPSTIHVAFGRHRVRVTAAGYEVGEATFEVTGKAPQTITVTLRATARARERPLAPWLVVGAGGAVALAGAAYHVLAFKPARDALAASGDLEDYEAKKRVFTSRRNVTIGLYCAGAATIATGVILRYTVFAGREAPLEVGASAVPHGGVAWVEWRR